MAEEKQNQGVSVEEYNKLQDDFKAQGEKLAKLEKIFEERQTKTLDKEGILKILGIEKAPEKPIADVLGEKLNTLSETISKLQDDIKIKDEKLAMNDKRAKVTEIAKKYNFIDINDVLGVIDYNNDDFDNQVKSLAESKKHWIQQADLGKSFTGAKQSGEFDKNDPFIKGFDEI
jgi:hypothetical protein